jgi:hypothetical protein
MTKWKFYQLLEKELKEHPYLRKGQAAYILMNRFFPELFHGTVAFNIDPFNDTSKTDRFVSYYLEQVNKLNLKRIENLMKNDPPADSVTGRRLIELVKNVEEFEQESLGDCVI